MATTMLAVASELSSRWRNLVRFAVLLLILILSALLLALNYWLGLTFLFVGLLALVIFGYKWYEARNLRLLLLFSGFTALLVASLAQDFFYNNRPTLDRLIQTYPTSRVFFESDEGIFLTSLLVGTAAALVCFVIPFFLFALLLAVLLLRWDQTGVLSWWQVFSYVVRSLLGIGQFSLVIEGEEIKGKEADKQRLETFGGPGRLIVYPGQVVVLHLDGKITRAVGRGSVMLKRGEKVRAILPLGGKGDTQKIEDVLTRDRVPLDITVSYAAQMEPAAETGKRLQQTLADAKASLQDLKTQSGTSREVLEEAEQRVKDAAQKLQDLKKDKIIGDDYNVCYESIARLAAAKAPKPAEALTKPVANNLIDVIMSEYTENLFHIDNGDDNLKDRINRRKIAKIEKLVFEKAKQAKVGDGVVLRGVDIQHIYFPDDIGKKINEEVATLIEERIQQTEAKIRVMNAESEQKRATFEAKATIIEARAKGQARIVQGQSEGEALAAMFREVLRELKREDVKDNETLKVLLSQLSSSPISSKELQELIKLRNLSTQINIGSASESNGKAAQN